MNTKMKKRLFVLLLCSVLISGCSGKTTGNTPSEAESISDEAGESEDISAEREEEEATEEEEIVADEAVTESGQENAAVEANEPIFSEFEELCFFKDCYSPSYFVFRLSKDGTFEGEIKTFYDSPRYDNTYNRFSGSFEVTEKITDGIYKLYMKELYLLYEPGSIIQVSGENGDWKADSLTSFVRGHSFYLCLKNADIGYLPEEVTDSYIYYNITQNSTQSDYLINSNVSYGYRKDSECYFTSPSENVIADFPRITDTVTGINRKGLTPLVFTVDEGCSGILDYKVIENAEDIYNITYYRSKYYEKSYFENYLELSNFGITDVDVGDISVEILKYIPLEEVDYLCNMAGGGDSVPEAKGLYVELDPFRKAETSVTEAELEYRWEGAFPEIVPTYKKYQGDFLSRGETILYVVGVDFKNTGYYEYCFYLDYMQLPVYFKQ